MKFQTMASIDMAKELLLLAKNLQKRKVGTCTVNEIFFLDL